MTVLSLALLIQELRFSLNSKNVRRNNEVSHGTFTAQIAKVSKLYSTFKG